MDTLRDLENLITSALEKILLSGYLLRICVADKECINFLCDSLDFGSMDDISEVSGGKDGNDSEYELLVCSPSKIEVSKSFLLIWELAYQYCFHPKH